MEKSEQDGKPPGGIDADEQQRFELLRLAIADGEGFPSIDASAENLVDMNVEAEMPETRRDSMPHEEAEPLPRVRFLSEPFANQPNDRQRSKTAEPARGRRRHLSRRLSMQVGRAKGVTLNRMRKVSERTFSTVGPQDENPDRGNWSNQFEFFLSCLGYAVGLGNVWRFPYLCHKNGGGAFLIPYALMLIFCGMPLLFIELSLGQYSSEGPITIWKMSRIFKGIGVSMVLISMLLATYYNMITAWAIYYLYQSLTSFLPWTCCDPAWAAPDCVSFIENCTGGENSTGGIGGKNMSDVLFSADDYFHKVALELVPSIADIGPIRLHLFIFFTIAWLVVFMVLMKGIKSFGKTVYFTSTFPYLVLTILFIRGVIEPGAYKGIIYYLEPKWERLLEAGVWGDAVTQIFFSTGICTGGVITLSSYNRFHNNVYRDALIIGFGNSMTSIFSGFVVFSILGFMAERGNATVEEVVREGPGLTFIIYPQAVTLLPVSPVWSSLFFLMLVTLALSSMFPTVENVTTAIIDQFKILRPYKFWMTMVTCLSLYGFGLTLTTGGGMYVLQLLDKFAVGFPLVIVGAFEIFVFAWIYGTHRLYKDIEAMTLVKLTPYWAIIWRLICPGLLLFALLFSIIDFQPLEYNKVLFPYWANILGWVITLIVCLPIPIYAIYFVASNRELFGEMGLKGFWKASTTPTNDWGPAIPQFWTSAEMENMLSSIKKEDEHDDVFS